MRTARLSDSTTDLIGINLKDASPAYKAPTPLMQVGALTGAGMTIDASSAGGLVLTGVDSTSGKHTAYRVAPDQPTITKLSEGFLSTETKSLLDAAHVLDERNGSTTLWTIYPAKNYSASGLFDLLQIDLVAADPTQSELLRHTMPGAGLSPPPPLAAAAAAFAFCCACSG